MTIQADIDLAQALTNTGAGWVKRVKQLLADMDGHLGTIADPTLSYLDDPVSLTQGVAMTPASPTSGGGPTAYYVADDQLPPGIHLDRTTGVISGTPTEVQSSTDYTIRAVGFANDATFEFTITVSAP